MVHGNIANGGVTMAASLRRLLAVTLAGAMLVVCGCNAASMAYFLFGEDSLKPECEVFAAPKKEIKVVFLTYVDTDMRAEFIRADRDVNELLTRWLKKRYEDNKDKIKVVPPGLVESFKDKNPNWHTMSMKEIGDYFHASFVVNIEMDHLSLYEPHSLNEFFRGLAQVTVTVHNPEKPEDGPVFRKDFTFKFPTQGPRSVLDNNNLVQFRAEFLQYMVRQMARCFARFSMEEKYPCE
jgi:hypothetical protein